MSRPRALLTACAVVLMALGSATTTLGRPGVAHLSQPGGQAASNPVPFLAYYYIWFDRTSWDRAKRDFPALGRYSSDDPSVMRQHIRWAKAAGITGFIVSWKSTTTLDRRLEMLIQVATEEHFTLAIIYEGLDFNRKPLPAARVEADLLYFQQHYALNAVFRIFEKPLVIFSGTWAYTVVEVESVTANLRQGLLILASEKNVKGYQRIQHLVDGDAYYWSSVNPDTYSGYQGKLDDMAAAIHASGGLWIAPAAPGFNGTLLGGVAVVDRKDGDTLRQEVAAAVQSGPDAVGLISWNEFSENSYVEPSHLYAGRYLQVLSDIHHLPPPAVDLLGSTADESPAGATPPPGSDAGRLIALALLVATLAVAPIMLARRARRAIRG
jgi:hypothetical protein